MANTERVEQNGVIPIWGPGKPACEGSGPSPRWEHPTFKGYQEGVDRVKRARHFRLIGPSSWSVLSTGALDRANIPADGGVQRREVRPGALAGLPESGSAIEGNVAALGGDRLARRFRFRQPGLARVGP